MDALIRRFDFTEDNDLCFTARGIAYQKDMTKTVVYDEAYFHKCASYDQDIADRVNEGRVALVDKYHTGYVLDIGVGSGDFISKRPKTKGYDANPYANIWLKERNLYDDRIMDFKAVTLWDVLEHIDDPSAYFKHITRNAHVFVSLPIFSDLTQIRQSKHYRPNEHLYYFTRDGLVDWMAMYGFSLKEESDHEIKAGRESIGSFVFRRDKPDYNDYITLYRSMHERYYGASATMYLQYVLEVVQTINPGEILDYGCGRSDLSSYFWHDGERAIFRYDPAIPEYQSLPKGRFDLVLCCDVMEHIPMPSVDRILGEIRPIAKHVLFVISTIPARAKLPNGDNAHVTLLTKSEWMRWLKEYFHDLKEIPTQWPHVLMLLTSPKP